MDIARQVRQEFPIALGVLAAGIGLIGLIGLTAPAFLGIAIAVAPFAVVAALLRLADHVARRREARIARQIALTDAIHRELGAVAAPVVRRRRGGWLVSMTAPLGRPGTTAALVRITERMFAAEAAAPDRLRIVLRPDAAHRAAGPPRPAGRRRLAAPAPAAPALR